MMDEQNMTPIDSDTKEMEEEIGFQDDPTVYFTEMPAMAFSLKSAICKSYNTIKQTLLQAPQFIHLVKSMIPKKEFRVMLNPTQRKQLAEGALKLMSTKKGELKANLVNPKTGKIVSTLSLKEISDTPGLDKALADYASQMQMVQIAKNVQQVQIAVEEIRQGQENDRLASAYSCQQKLLQATKIENPQLREAALLRIAQDAEDSRNRLMLSQSANIECIKNEPESIIQKFLSGSSAAKINDRMNAIREGLCTMNSTTLAEAIAYQELGEMDAARESLLYYAQYIQKTYIEVPQLLERLDMIDPSPTNYWTKMLPVIQQNINALPCMTSGALLTEGER